MTEARAPQITSRGFSITTVVLGTFLLTAAMAGASKLASVPEYFAVNAEAAEFEKNYEEARRITIGHDVDRRIRITGERSYVRERRAGAGWLFEEAYVLPDNMEIYGPEITEFCSRCAVTPATIYTISSSAFSHEIMTKDKRLAP